MPSKELPPNTDLRRAPLLAAQVEIEIAAGDLDRARWAGDELARVAAKFESKALAASASLARGRVRLAEGDTADVERHYEDAARLWHEVGAPHETGLARMGLAEAHRARGNEQRAVMEQRAARAILERVGAMHQDGRADGAEDDIGHRRASGPELDVFRREGDYWSVTFAGQTVRVRDVKGMRSLAQLLADPGREFHVMDLVATARGGTARVGGGTEPGLAHSALGAAGAMLDRQAKEAYRRRLAEIEGDLEEARALGDAERDFLVRELSRAVGLGGRDRQAGSASERARASVTRAVRQAVARIREHHPPLGEHLDRAIRTGTYCAYLSDPRSPVGWKF